LEHNCGFVIKRIAPNIWRWFHEDLYLFYCFAFKRKIIELSRILFLNECHFRICNRQINRNTIDSGDSHNEEIENMNEQLKMYKKRVEYISKTNDQLRCDLIKTVRQKSIIRFHNKIAYNFCFLD